MKKMVMNKSEWLIKILSGLILGYLFALLLAGIFTWVGPGHIDEPVRVQFIMWVVTPIWLMVFSLTFLFRTSKQALFTLLGVNVLAYLILSIAQSSGG